MVRKVFYSFHYDADNWRAGQVRNVGVVEGNQPAADNDWESIKQGGNSAIQRWIDDQISGRSCAVVLIGSATAGRTWISYEIAHAWNTGKGVVGVHVHNLKDRFGNQSLKGSNPFDDVTMNRNNSRLSSVAKAYDPPYVTSTYVYDHITANLSTWVEEAISIRNGYG
jgi:hypothetical protein